MQNEELRVLNFAFCILNFAFAFCILHFAFCILHSAFARSEVRNHRINRATLDGMFRLPIATVERER